MKNEIKININISSPGNIKLFNDNYISQNLKENIIELYINNIKYNFQNNFQIEKKGEYIIILKFKNQVKSCKDMFAENEYINSIDLSYFDFEKVTDMSKMFYKCKILKSINLSSVKTKKVIVMK